MSRHLLLREGDGSERTIAEARLATEAELHDALADHPELVPGADLGLGRTVVVGKESPLGGDADMLLLDEHGQLCLVEVKKPGNPDARRVVAQLLGYAAHLWGQTLEEFWETIVLRYWVREHQGEDPPANLAQFLERAFHTSGEHDESPVNVERLLANLEAGLQRGSFILLVAAPEIPASVERTLAYLNAQGLQMNALEVSYFNDAVTCFVPRLRLSVPARHAQRRRALPLSEEEFTARLPLAVAARISETTEQARTIGAEVDWTGEGASLKLTHERRSRQVALFMPTALFVAVHPAAGLPSLPFEQAHTQLEQLGGGELVDNGNYWRIRYNQPTVLDRGCAILLELLGRLRE